ncbi:MAG: TIGR01777 family protein [Bacteroidetes bacterium 43-16]|nr:MAG: TIGR01777 family protein [Bacteroidetes bacterium 43-16]
MKIVIAGGSGFLGKALQQYFEAQQHTVLILSRTAHKSNHIAWDGKNQGNWSAAIEGTDVLINLTGKSVDCRYTAANKQAILASRIDSTKALQEAVNRASHQPALWINASSATIYIHAETRQMDEYNGTIGDDFSMNVCKQWEATFFEEKLPGLRKVALRTSIVLGNEGGAYPKLKALTKAYMGGSQGDGRQMMSWIHIHDFCRAVAHIIRDQEIDGAVNVTAPYPISNKDFMQAMRHKYRRSFGLSQNRLLLELGAIFLRTEAELLLKSRNVFPEKLSLQGFSFDYPKLELALQNL